MGAGKDRLPIENGAGSVYGCQGFATERQEDKRQKIQLEKKHSTLPEGKENRENRVTEEKI